MSSGKAEMKPENLLAISSSSSSSSGELLKILENEEPPLFRILAKDSLLYGSDLSILAKDSLLGGALISLRILEKVDGDLKILR